MRRDTGLALIAGAVAGLPLGVLLTALGMLGEISHPGPSYLTMLELVPFEVVVLLAAGLSLSIGACLGAVVGLLFVRFVNRVSVLERLVGNSTYSRAALFSAVLWVLCAIAAGERVILNLWVWLLTLIVVLFEGVVFVNLFTRWMKEQVLT